jgi:hypothetical protein
MKKENNKELNSTTQKKSVEPMFENNLTTENKAAIDKVVSDRYVVTRDGYRVSDKEYSTTSDKSALDELKFWNKVSKNHSWGEKVEIVQYDPKKHRVW